MRDFRYHVSESNQNHNEIIMDLKIPSEVARYAYVHFVSKTNHLLNGEELDLVAAQIHQWYLTHFAPLYSCHNIQVKKNCNFNYLIKKCNVW